MILFVEYVCSGTGPVLFHVHNPVFLPLSPLRTIVLNIEGANEATVYCMAVILTVCIL